MRTDLLVDQETQPRTNASKWLDPPLPPHHIKGKKHNKIVQFADARCSDGVDYLSFGKQTLFYEHHPHNHQQDTLELL